MCKKLIYLISFVLVLGLPQIAVALTQEAESMTLTNYTVNTNSADSGGSLIKLSGSGVTGTATYNFSGTTGTYDIKVWYFDENDGECTFRIYVGGAMVDEWVANQDLGSIDPVAATRTSRTKAGVSIAKGAQIKLEAVQNSEEWGRYDNVEITPAAPPPGVQMIPVESGTLAGEAMVFGSANAEDGQYVGYLHSLGASVTVSGVDGGTSGGSYTLTIRYATGDTDPSLDLYVNGTLIRTLTFTNTDDWETFSSTSTSITLKAGTGNTIMLKHDSSNSGGVNLDTFRVQEGNKDKVDITP